MAAYATVAQYRAQTGDQTTDAERVEVALDAQSAKLRGECRITADLELSEDAETLARFLVVDAAYKGLKTDTLTGIGPVEGVTEASFAANGFQGSYTFQNPSGASYWDGATLKAFKRLIGKTQAVGIMAPCYGGR